MVLWIIGAGLKVMFSQTTPMSVYVITLIIEGAGIDFVLQPGQSAMDPSTFPSHSL